MPPPLQAGEGLYNIALAYTLTVDDLLSVNAGLTTTSTLQIGQVPRRGAEGLLVYEGPQ